MEEVKNAFQSVRPRGVDMPSAVPLVTKAGPAPAKLPGSLPRVLDRKGCLNAPLAPRAYGSISVEGRVAGEASQLKRQAIVKGGL